MGESSPNNHSSIKMSQIEASIIYSIIRLITSMTEYSKLDHESQTFTSNAAFTRAQYM